ncbi:8.4 kDa cro protein [Halomonas phage QHHSV-1]|nr:8.4 kDa cro protein [Halomonas phage QHHSV-1]
MTSIAPPLPDASATTIEALIQDCGGVSVVARALKLSRQSVWEWLERGRLPWSELDGRTQYAPVLAGMQRELSLSVDDIRRIGLTI